jgi:hypothetical protein
MEQNQSVNAFRHSAGRRDEQNGDYEVEQHRHDEAVDRLGEHPSPNTGANAAGQVGSDRCPDIVRLRSPDAEDPVPQRSTGVAPADEEIERDQRPERQGRRAVETKAVSGSFSGGKRNQIAAAKGDSTEIEEQSRDALPRRSSLDNIRHVYRFGTSIETRKPQTAALQKAIRSIGRNCGSQGSNGGEETAPENSPDTRRTPRPIPHRARCTAGALPTAISCLGTFSDAGRHSAWIVSQRPVLKQVLPWRSPNSAAEIDPEPTSAVHRSTSEPRAQPLEAGGSENRYAQFDYSITSSACSRIDCGTVKPSALAVLRFTTISNLVGNGTGRSPGFAPRRM